MGNTTKPKTDLELFQALQIEALQKELLKAKELLAELQIAIEKYVNEIEVKF